MIVGIDASAARGGGGLIHIVELLRAANPVEQGFSQVIVWSGKATLDRIEDRPWLVKRYESLLDRSLPYRVFWQRFRLARLSRASGCDVLFVPGGSYAGDFRPIVTLNQNLLPFDWPEMRRYRWSLMGLRLMLLHWAQSRTFRQAEGVIFLTNHARDAVMLAIKTIAGKTAIIAHGIDGRFVCPPREQFAIDQYSDDRPFRMLYVSIIDMYKHQWNVAQAVAQLRKSNLPVVLDLVGPAYPPALNRLRMTLDRIDPDRKFVRYSGTVPYEELHARYRQADLCIFASSCETFGQILTEAMSAGLPIACSNRSAMPELLGDAGAYFDPENPKDIAGALAELLRSPERRIRLARASFERAQGYSWQSCARKTFTFLSDVASPRYGRRANYRLRGRLGV